jgi:hypothetical protein
MHGLQRAYAAVAMMTTCTPVNTAAAGLHDQGHRERGRTKQSQQRVMQSLIQESQGSHDHHRGQGSHCSTWVTWAIPPGHMGHMHAYEGHMRVNMKANMRPSHPHTLTNTHHSLTNTPHSLKATSYSLTNTAHSLTNTPHSLSNTPHSLTTIPHSLTNTPHSPSPRTCCTTALKPQTDTAPMSRG